MSIVNVASNSGRRLLILNPHNNQAIDLHIISGWSWQSSFEKLSQIATVTIRDIFQLSHILSSRFITFYNMSVIHLFKKGSSSINIPDKSLFLLSMDFRWIESAPTTSKSFIHHVRGYMAIKSESKNLKCFTILHFKIDYGHLNFPSCEFH